MIQLTSRLWARDGEDDYLIEFHADPGSMYVFCVLFDPRIDVIWEGVKACARAINIPFSSYFDVHQGIKVLTHSHIWRLICNIYIFTHTYRRTQM